MLLILLPQIYRSIKSDAQFTENPYDSLEPFTISSKNFDELTADQKIDEMLHHINVITAQIYEMLARLNNHEQKLELLKKGFLAITEDK